MNRYIHLKTNPMRFSGVYIEYEGNNLAIRFSNGEKEQTILAGNGEYIRSSYRACWKKPKLLSIMHAKKEEEICVASCYKTEENGITVFSRYTNNPASELLEITQTHGKLRMEIKSDFIAPNARFIEEK